MADMVEAGAAEAKRRRRAGTWKRVGQHWQSILLLAAILGGGWVARGVVEQHERRHRRVERDVRWLMTVTDGIAAELHVLRPPKPREE